MGKVDQHVADTFEVVSPALLNSKVGVDGGVPGCSCEIFILFIGDVLMSFGVSVFFAEAEVDEMNDM